MAAIYSRAIDMFGRENNVAARPWPGMTKR
jgi:hypothetical protein